MKIVIEYVTRRLPYRHVCFSASCEQLCQMHACCCRFVGLGHYARKARSRMVFCHVRKSAQSYISNILGFGKKRAEMAVTENAIGRKWPNSRSYIR